MFGSLGLDPVALGWQIVAFIGLIVLLNRLLFRPIRKTMDERARRIEASMEEAERVKQQAIRADQSYQARIEEAQQQAQSLAEESRGQARQEREKILEQARAEAQQLLQDARTQFEMERRDAARETRRQVAGLAVLAASRLIGENLDTEKNRRLIEQNLVALDQPLEELNLALASLPPEKILAAQVRSATPLPDETQTDLRARLLRALHREIPMAVTVEPRLIGGFVLQVGDQVIDLSVARKLGDLFDELVV